MTFNQRIMSVIKNLGLLYFLLLVFIFILFASIILTIPESAVSERVIVSLIGSGFFFVIINIILSNANAISLQKINQETHTQFNESSFNVRESTVNSMFTNIIHISSQGKIFISLTIGAILGITLFFLSTSHYLFYIVDNSGSMGFCPNWTFEKGCPKPFPDPDKTIVKTVTNSLSGMFETGKNIGGTEVSKSSLPIFPFYKFTSDVKVGLIEIGGEARLNGQCSANELVEPSLNNGKQLLDGLAKIKVNCDGVTAIIKALKQADYSINLKTSNPLKYAASKNVILFTDSNEDNCEGQKRNFCAATSELPEGFNVKLNIYGIKHPKQKNDKNDNQFSCDKFKCGKKYSVDHCKVISPDQIKQNSIPKLGLELSLSPRLTTISYTSLALSLICLTCITGMILKYREELFNSYLKQVYLFIDKSTIKIKKANNNFMEFLKEEEKISRFKLFIILVIFVILIGLLLLLR